MTGIASCVPRNIEKNIDNPIFETIDDAKKFIETTGVIERRISTKSVCTSDLTIHSSKQLVEKLNWDFSDIGILICITQTPDYHGPMNSSIIQDKLGLSKSCIVFDIPIGCSGFVYGTTVISSMMKTYNISKGLLLVGDTLSKQSSPKDKSTQPLFGDAGASIAFMLTNDNQDKITFELGGDGSGYKSLYLKDGGYRNPYNKESLEYYTTNEGLSRNGCHTIMEGMDVFSFGITTVPKTVNNILNFCNLNVENIDYFLFHQANYFMLDMIRKKLKINLDKIPFSISKYGNTSSATIPLTMVSELKNELESKKLNLIFCGFGIGLSWGTMFIKTEKMICLEILEL